MSAGLPCGFRNSSTIFCSLSAGRLATNYGKFRCQCRIGVVVLLGKRLGPVHRQGRTGCRGCRVRRSWGDGDLLLSSNAGGGVEGLGEHLALSLPVLMPRSSSDTASARNSPRNPSAGGFLRPAADVLGASRRHRFRTQAAASHQRDDGQHLGGGAQFHDREQVGEGSRADVAGDEMVSRPRDHALEREAHGARTWDMMLDVEAGGVVILQVGLHPS